MPAREDLVNNKVLSPEEKSELNEKLENEN